MIRSVLYAVMILLSFAAAYVILRIDFTYDNEQELKLLFPCLFVSTIFGAATYTVIVTALQGNLRFGLSSLGAAIGMFICTVIYSKARRIKETENLFDCVVRCLPLIYGFSKFGCFIKGCCGGYVADIPVQLVEAAFFLTFFFLAITAEMSAELTIIISAGFKILIESFREGVSVPNANQVVCLGIVLCDIIWIIIKAVKKKRGLKNDSDNVDRTVSVG